MFHTTHIQPKRAARSSHGTQRTQLMTTTKANFDRVPFRRGSAEESALRELKRLGEQHSQFVPALSSDNLWLRFSIRLLAELRELVGDQPLTFQVGEPTGALHEHGNRNGNTLRVLGAPPTELSAGTAEARLRLGETNLLKELGKALKHPSRSATLRHALFACQQVCERAKYGDAPWVERAGAMRVLPSLIDIAATMEQGDDASVRLLCSDLARPRPAPPKAEAPATPTTHDTIVFCSVEPSEIEQLSDAQHVEILSPAVLLRRAGARELKLDVKVAAHELDLLREQGAKLRVTLQLDNKLFAEAITPPARPLALPGRATDHAAPEAVGADNVILIRGARGSSRRSAKRQSIVS